jgi:hypothetical protein
MAPRRQVPDRWTPPRANPRPAAWSTLPPGTPYACAPWEAGQVGRTVPGRAGGTIIGCATPARRGGDGQWLLGRPGKPDRTIRKKTARRRRERAASTIVPAVPREQLAASVEYAKAHPERPFPIGTGFPHPAKSSKCSSDHPTWKGYAAALTKAERARERALERDPFLSEEELNEVAADALAKARGFKRWRDVTTDCVRGVEYVDANRRPRATESSTREAQRRRIELLGLGYDEGSAEYLDTLSPSGRAKALRRLGRAAEARDLERDIRARRRSALR